MAYRLTGKPEPPRYGDKVVGLVEYRDGTILDVIRNVYKGKWLLLRCSVTAIFLSEFSEMRRSESNWH